MGLGLALYGLALIYQSFSSDPLVKHQIKCRYCKKYISDKVSSIFHAIYTVQPMTDERTAGYPMCQLHELAGWPRGENALRL
jgi:hypothetical protein